MALVEHFNFIWPGKNRQQLSLLPSPDFSKIGFMGTCSRAVSTLISPVPAFMGSDAPFVLAELGKDSVASRGSRAASLLPYPAL